MKTNSNLITWSDTYSVGIKIIDEQHKKFIDMVNDMYRHGNDDEEEERAFFQSIIKEFVGYVKFHFETEEKIMKGTDFQGYTMHKKVHASFILSLLDIIKKIDNGKRIPLITFSHFCREWILTHIAIMDKQYFEHLMRIISLKRKERLNDEQADIAC